MATAMAAAISRSALSCPLLGIDPFSESEEVIYPETVAQFIEIYERALRA